MKRPARGFTLIELLVVVTIIVVLLALLTPALDKAMESAVRVRCGANLHAWSLAVPQYSFDNKRKILTTAQYFSLPTNPGGVPYPYAPFVHSETKPGQISFEAMGPYLGTSTGNTHLGDAWYCPANTVPGKSDWNDKMIRQGKGAADPTHEGDWLQVDYSYYAGVGQWTQYAPWPEDLTNRSLTPGRMLMTDTALINNSGLWYNHGVFYSPTHKGEPAISGGNYLYGDGAVNWRDSFDKKRNEAVVSRSEPDLGHYVSSNGNASGALHLY